MGTERATLLIEMDKAQSTISWSKCSECTVHRHFCGTKCALFFFDYLSRSRVCVQPLSIAVKRSVHYFCDFSFFQKNKF